MKTTTDRNVTHVITAHQQLEGGGFLVRRPFPTAGLDHIDPFLLLDEMGPAAYGPGEAVGAPDHPHRGFETVTYMVEGEFEHADSAGHRGAITPGDVQWMTAGRGIIHAEMPSQRIREQGGRVHGFQLWVNLPAAEKMMAPRYQEVPASAIPEATSADGRAHVRVIAGEALGVQAVIDTRTPILYQDWRLEPGADLEQPIPEGYQAFVYVFQGQAEIGSDERLLAEGQAGILGPGDRVRLAVAPGAPSGARLLLLAGRPIGEPVARYGPFVMNTRAEIMQAVRDYQTGRLVEAG
jgi:redox-sensitive bicupin YhaK (pirin superfamily)